MSDAGKISGEIAGRRRTEIGRQVSTPGMEPGYPSEIADIIGKK